MKSLCPISQVIKRTRLFIENGGYSREADAVDMVASAHIASMKQTTLQDYFIPHLLLTESKSFISSWNTYSNRGELLI
jgi:hypothetical protein